MSDPTPRPERVTLTDEEIAELGSLIRPWTVCDDGGGFDHGSTRAARRVAEWFAAREQALREEIEKVEAERDALIALFRANARAAEHAYPCCLRCGREESLQARLDAIAAYAGHPGNWGASDHRGRLIYDLATGAIDPGVPGLGRHQPARPEGITSMSTNTRLSININEKTQATLRKETEGNGVTLTEAVRRSVALLEFIRDAEAKGQTLQLLHPDGTVFNLVVIR